MSGVVKEVSLPIEVQMCNAIKAGNEDFVLSEFRKAIADPTIKIEYDAVFKDLNSGDKFSLLLEAVDMAHAEVINVIFEYARCRGRTIDLSKNPVEDPESFKMNTFQLACLYAIDESMEAIYDYAIATGQKPIELFSHSYPDVRFNLVDAMLKTLDVSSILANFVPHSNEEVVSIKLVNYIRTWAHLSPGEESFEPDPEICNAEGEIEIDWIGAVANIMFLMQKGVINGKEMATSGSLRELGLSCFRSTQNARDWQAFQDLLYTNGLEITSEARTDEKGNVYFTATMRNLRGAHPLKVRIYPNMEDLAEVLNPMAGLQDHKVATQLQQLQATTEQAQQANEARLRKHSEGLEENAERFRRHSEDLADLREIKIKRGRPADATQANLYDIIVKGVLRKFDAEDLKQAHAFKVQLTSSTAKTAQRATFLLKGLIAIGSEAAATLVGLVGDHATKHLQNQHDNETYQRVVNECLEDLAIKIAYELATSGKVKTSADADAAVAKIIAQYDNLHKFNPESGNDRLVDFLCSPVINDRPAVITHSGSSSSAASSGNGSPKQVKADVVPPKAAVANDTPKKKKAACVLM